MMMRIASALAASLLIGVSQTSHHTQTIATANAESMREIPICDLFRRLDSFNGKRVAVRGVYRFSFELAGLYSEGCQKPLVLDGTERGQALDTSFAAESLEQRTSLAHFHEIVEETAKLGKRQAIHVTLVGILVTRNPNLHRLGQYKGERMFGHLGAYPAQIKVSEVENIVIEDDARKPSNMELQK